MKKIFAAIMTSLMFAACGANDGAAGPGNVDVMRVMIDRDTVEVGGKAQMSVEITLNDGTVIEGLTTEFIDPLTGDEYAIEWLTLNENIARMGDDAQLIPWTAGFVEVVAHMAGLARSRVVRIDDPTIPRIAAPSPSISETPEDDAPPEERPDDPFIVNPPDNPPNDPPDDPQPNDPPEDPPPGTACQGFAERVVSFKAGVNAGFGASDLPDIVLGPPEGAGALAGSFDVVSLGLGGEIVIDVSPCEIVDGPGADFIVFENAFFINGDPTAPFQELAGVGVSLDGIHAAYFACASAAYPFIGCAGWNPVYSNTTNGISPFNTASAGGDQYDLATVGMTRARYIHIVDIGTAGAAPTAGFDLDAVAVVNGETAP